MQQHEIRDHIVSQIRSATIELQPYPHLLISELLPQQFYDQILAELTQNETWKSAVYPGTGVNLSATPFHDHGLVLTDWQTANSLRAIHAALEDDAFATALSERFRQGPGDDSTGWIPNSKREFLDTGNFTTVFDIHRDLPGYEITPHADVSSKILTFMLYLEPDDFNAAWGTHLCVPANGLSYDQVKASDPFPGHPNWLPWELFHTDRVAEARPNTFFAFAPHARSYHAVKLDPPPDHQRHERTLLRGFVREGRSTDNWLKLQNAE